MIKSKSTKQFVITSFLLCLGYLSFSQIHFGTGLGLNLEDFNIGLHGRVGLDINETYELNLGYTTYFKNNDININTLDIDGYYNLVRFNDDQIAFRPLAGLKFLFTNPEIGENNMDIGINAGAMIQIDIDRSFDLFIEPRFLLIDDFSGFYGTIGIVF